MVMCITQDELVNSLIDAQYRGVEINIIIDDEYLYSSGSDYQELLDSGIDIRGDERSGLMHHKVMIIDNYVIIIGSYNWSASAEDSNDENVIFLKSSRITEEYLSEFNRLWSRTTPPQQPTVTEPTEYVLTLILSGSGYVTISEGLNEVDIDSPDTVELFFTIGEWVPENPIEIETSILAEVISIKLDGVDITQVEEEPQKSGYTYLSYFGDWGIWAIYMEEDHEVKITFKTEETEQPSVKYVGSINSDVYHYLWCSYVKNIKEENKIYFSSSQEARSAGYRPCKVCKPP